MRESQDRRRASRLNKKVYRRVVRPAMVYGLETTIEEKYRRLS